MGFVACSSAKGPFSGGSGQSSENQGSIGLKLTLSGGEHISQVTYTLANAAHTIPGTYNIGATTNLSFVIGSVPAGSGYGLSLTATTDDNSVTCSFPGPGDAVVNNIAVLDGTTTNVSVNMQCTNNQGRDAGSVMLNAVTSNCPVWNTIVANPENITLDGGQNVNTTGSVGTTAAFGGSSSVPATIAPGQSLVLVGSATAPDPGNLVFNWSASPSGGALSSFNGTRDPNSTDAGVTDQTIFTCPPAGSGTYTITLSLTDGPLPPGGGCDSLFTTGTVVVNCQAAPSCPVGTGCGDGGQVCNVAGSCVPALFSVVVLNSLDGGVIGTKTTELPISIQSYTLGGTPVGTPIVLPTAVSGAQQPIALMGNDIDEGDLNLSTDGRYLTMTGWDSPPGGSQVGMPVVARIDSSGHVDTSTVAGGAFQNSGPFSYRSAVSKDGSGFWVSGVDNDNADDTGGGIWYVPFAGTTATQLLSLPNSAVNGSADIFVRFLRIYNGQLFSGSDQSPPYMFSIGTSGGPLPTSGTQTLTTLPGGFTNPTGPMPPSPFGFLLFDLFAPPGPDTMYIADDGVNPAGIHDNGGAGSVDTGSAGLSKWSYSAGTGWTEVWNITSGNWPADAGATFSGKPLGYRGLAGFATGTLVTLMTTTANIQGNPDSLAVVFVDNASSVMPPPPNVVATTTPSQVFRGVALTPQ
jgi:hypothetical protein